MTWWPRDGQEAEDRFTTDGVDPAMTRADLVQIGRDLYGLIGVQFYRKDELVQFFENPDLRPTILTAVGDRQAAANQVRTARRQALVEALKRWPGKWRFAAVAKLPKRRYVDEITGSDVVGGLVLRDLRRRQNLIVGNGTARELRRRRKLPWFDVERLPSLGEAEPPSLVGPTNEEIDGTLDTFPSASAPTARKTVGAVDQILESLWPDEAPSTGF